MRITFHGHRPTGPCRNTSAVEDSSTQRPTQANANEQLVRTVNFGFFKVKVHRKTAAQASLLAQLRGQAGAAPAQPASTSTAQVSSSQSGDGEDLPASGPVLPTKLVKTPSTAVESPKPLLTGSNGRPPEPSRSKPAQQISTNQASNTAAVPKFINLGIVRSDSSVSDTSSLSNVSSQGRHKQVITQTQALPELRNYFRPQYQEQLLRWIEGDENCTDETSTDYRGEPANETRLEAYRRIRSWATSGEQPDLKEPDFKDLHLNSLPPLPKEIDGINVRLEI